MKFMRATLLALTAVLGLAACGEGTQVATLPTPREPGPDSVGYFCGMAVTEHPGPKGQVFLRGQSEPLWFTSVRDALAFTILPGEPRTVVALYVSDMGRSTDGREPSPGAWVQARDAVFVAGGTAVGGMGAREVVPFADRAAAERFRQVNGGTIYRFGEVPANLVLGADGGLASAPARH
jgi:copper chaperone NosL